ncbi:MAG: phosphoribosylformylglycinamidine synthase [Oscillospiraceae bacterium]|jgi:phosphoribosylformylglycinamidine synthase|nr:phosphoribosylformylglycinamidine synthase [Oscillospiraceae bacterium]
MSLVIRVFVEKKSGYDVEAKSYLSDLRDNLEIKSLKSLRLLNRYDISGLTAEQYAMAKGTIFSEPNADDVYEECFECAEGDIAFATEYLPGQFDQRADSAAQCVQLLTCEERPLIRTAQVFILSGGLTEEETAKIKKYIINPVESREALMDKPDTLLQNYDIPLSVETLTGFISRSDEEIEQYHAEMGFAMTANDLIFCRDYFRDTEKRDPTITEIKVIDTYWSDHCRHTTFLTILEEIKVTKGDFKKTLEKALSNYLAARKEIYTDKYKPVTMMDMGTIGAKVIRRRGLLDDLDLSEEINACSIEVPVIIDGQAQQWLIQFKNETHNHPTEIEPFGGAATCLGGAIRDPLSGRAYVYQAMRVTGAADPTVPVADTIPGKLPQRKITTKAAAGYSSYGNQIGLATGQVTELYHAGYAAKRMEIGAVVGASPKENVRREEPKPGDVVVLLGGRTGRDGCGGATGSSKAHTGESLETCGAEVQKGNPPTERKIQRLFTRSEVTVLIKRCNDFGAGGVCVAIGELADGLSIRLDDVRKKYDGLDGTELAISESQERMAVVLGKEDAEKFIAYANEENLEAYEVAWITENPRLKMKWNGSVIVDISREFLNTNGVKQLAKAKLVSPSKAEDYRHAVPASLADKPLSEAIAANMSRLEVCSQKGLSERFDSSIGAATVLMPFAGENQLTPEEAMVAKIPLKQGETDCATAMSYGGIPGILKWSPYHGAAYAVVESLSKLLAVGADPLTARLTFQEYFERLRGKSKRWGKPVAALLGALEAQMKLNIPSIGGKDSMSGSFDELDVPPTLVSFAISMTSAEKTISAAFGQGGLKVVFFPVPENEETRMPKWKSLRAMYSAVYELIKDGKILSASVVKEGGVAAAVCKMCFGNDIGFDFAPKYSVDTPEVRELLFAPLSGGVVAALAPDTVLPKGVHFVEIGCTEKCGLLRIGGEIIDVDDIKDKWMGTLENVFPNKPSSEPTMLTVPEHKERAAMPSRPAAIAKPRVFIPVFPGTNCEYDTARAFSKAGAVPEIFVVRNLSSSDIENSIREMTRIIENSQIIMIPGGFSGGDEPDGSGKFIATTFRNPMIAAAVTNLLEKRDGLMLGICNGFQALIKLGLLPEGRITDIEPEFPTLTFNTLGRHVSRMVYTKVSSVLSPWLSGCNVGDIHAVPVSHGEGRFIGSEAVINTLIERGQIATQYVDPSGTPSSDILWNPNGSVAAIEGITSANGRVLGKMAHSERMGDNLYKNVPGEKDQKIFESGVRYFG